MYTQIYPLEIRHGFSSQGSLVLILAEPRAGTMVPMLIGFAEAQSIMLAQEHKATLRPMTHQLMLNIMQSYGLKLEQVVIERFEEGVFYASLHVSDGFNQKCIDSRSSDAITLALLADCPIFMNDDVIKETAVPDSILTSDNDTATEENIEELERQLKQLEDEEEYEQAAKLLEKIERLKQNR